MAKTSKKKLSRELKNSALELFAANLKNAGSADSAGKLLDRFFTPTEKEIILRRLTAAIMLGKGQKYRKVQGVLRISRNTISKAKRILSGDGYGRNLRKRIYSAFPLPATNRKKRFWPYNTPATS
jgi:uncharacterized protein YerC